MKTIVDNRVDTITLTFKLLYSFIFSSSFVRLPLPIIALYPAPSTAFLSVISETSLLVSTTADSLP